MKFAPLHIVTGYSFLQSGLTMEKVARAIKSNNYFGGAISDNEVMYGIPEFAKELTKLNKLCNLILGRPRCFAFEGRAFSSSRPLS